MHKFVKTVLAVCGLAAAGGAHAATATTTFQVTATVNSACIASATAMAFPNYTPGGGFSNQTSSVSVRCTLGTSYSVALSAGTFGGSVTTRQMGFGAQRLNYSLYRDAARTLNWGLTAPTDTMPGTGAGISAAATGFTVYGQVPDSAANQVVNPGAYTDTITVTINY